MDIIIRHTRELQCIVVCLFVVVGLWWQHLRLRSDLCIRTTWKSLVVTWPAF